MTVLTVVSLIFLVSVMTNSLLVIGVEELLKKVKEIMITDLQLASQEVESIKKFINDAHIYAHNKKIKMQLAA